MAKKSERARTDTAAALDFISALFGDDRTTSSVYFSSLANNDADPSEKGERRLVTRDAERLIEFLQAWNKPGRGMFFSVGTVTERRTKDGIVETIGLHADIDFKGVEYSNVEEIYAAIARLKCKPTVIVNSGHGVHLYWLFKQSIAAQENRDRIEELLRLVCDVVAGDPQVCEISRLMRLPGTHNTKFGSWVSVECVQLDGPRYELTDLEGWLGTRSNPLQRPILQRRVGENSAHSDAPTSPDDNPFTRQAHAQGYHPPIDVEARIAAMTVGGVGDAGVHATQRDVAASLLSRGEAVDAVVQRIITATQLLPGTADWDWRKEMRKVHNLCLTWLNKKPEIAAKQHDEEPIEPTPDPGPDGITKATKPPKTPGKPKRKEAHVVLAKGVLETIIERGERIMVHATGTYWYIDNLWQLLDDKELKKRLNREIEIGAAVLNLVTDNKLCTEAREWLLRRPEIYQPDVELDAHGKVPVINGLVDPRTGMVDPPKPEHYATWRFEHSYLPHAKCKHWLRVLGDTLGNRDAEEQTAYVQLVQELLGASLIDNRPKALSRALILVGGPDSGKSVLLEILGGLFPKAPITTKFSELEGSHGLMPFLRRSPWVLHEAFSGKWYPSDVVKSIVTGDPININVKNGAIQSHRFQGGIFWASNHPVSFTERTRAIAERIVIIEMQQKFLKDGSVGVDKIASEKGMKLNDYILKTESEGVLAWAFEGLRRCLERRCFDIPQASLDLAEDMQRDTNWVADFVADCVEYDLDSMVSTSDLYVAFCAYDRSNRSTEPPDPRSFGLSIQALNEQRIAIDRKLFRKKVMRFYCGIRLNEAGRELRVNEIRSKYFENRGKVAGVSEPEENPNKPVPRHWGDSEALKRAKRAHDRMDDQGKNSKKGTGHLVTNLPKGDQLVTSENATGHPENIQRRRGKPRF